MTVVDTVMEREVRGRQSGDTIKVETIVKVLKHLYEKGYIRYCEVSDMFSSRSQWNRLMYRLQREGLVELHGKIWYPTDKLYEVFR